MDRSTRLMSLDALRGADMVFIMGLSGAVMSLCSLIGFKDCWLSVQMTHVAWHGFHHHDTIFPLFLFLAGVSWPFSYASQIAKGKSQKEILAKIVIRVTLLVVLGLVSRPLFAGQFGLVRYDSILAHIGLCWGMGALLSMGLGGRGRICVIGALLVVHWLLHVFLTAPDASVLLSSKDPEIAARIAAYLPYGTGGFSFVGSISGWVDRQLMPGSLYEIVFDPDGLLAKMTGTVIAMSGIFAGEILKSDRMSGNSKVLSLLGCGAVALLLAVMWRPWCPINKKLWTSTFALAADAYAYCALAIFYWIIDVKGCRKWAYFFKVIGMNSITIYLLLDIVDFRQIASYFFDGLAGLGDASWNSLVLSLGQMLIAWLILWFLYLKNVFLKV